MRTLSQFSLRTALLAVTGLAVLLAIVTAQWRREARELALAAEIRNHEGFVELERRVDTLGFQCIVGARFWRGDVDETLLAKLAECRQLRVLQPMGCRIHGSLSPLARCRNLEMLNLGGATLDVQELRHLTKLPKLDAIWLDGTALGTKDTSFLRGFPRLRNLSIHDARSDQWHWEDIAACQQLEQLSITNSEITEDDLKCLARLPDLNILSLSGSAVSDSEFAQVARFSQLEFLGVQDCYLSLDALRKFRQAHPDCEVVRDYSGRPWQ
jgi:hypothetical protein